MEHTPDQPTNAELIRRKIESLQLDLEAEMAKRRAELRFGLERGRAVFEAEILRRHRELKVNLFAYLVRARPLVALTAPLIYGMVIPLAIVDFCVTIYQALCFPVYGIPKVKRSDYFQYDRAGLAYLNMLQKLNCAYCSYGNGVAGYVREIAGRTEAYWCPIKHARKVIGAQEYYSRFADFGDAEGFQKIAKDGVPIESPTIQTHTQS